MKLALLFLAFIFAATAQAALTDSLPGNKTTSLSKIKLTNGQFIKGYITRVDDSSITVVRKEDWKNFRRHQTEHIAAENISDITKNFKNGLTMGEGMLIGGLTGIVIGFTLGLSQDCDDVDGECDFMDKLLSTKSFSASLILGSVLGVAGLFTGMFSKKKDRIRYTINGNRNNIRNNRIGLSY